MRDDGGQKSVQLHETASVRRLVCRDNEYITISKARICTHKVPKMNRGSKTVNKCRVRSTLQLMILQTDCIRDDE